MSRRVAGKPKPSAAQIAQTGDESPEPCTFARRNSMATPVALGVSIWISAASNCRSTKLCAKEPSRREPQRPSASRSAEKADGSGFSARSVAAACTTCQSSDESASMAKLVCSTSRRSAAVSRALRNKPVSPACPSRRQLVNATETSPSRNPILPKASTQRLRHFVDCDAS